MLILKVKILFKYFLKLFKHPGTVDKVSPTDSGIPPPPPWKPWNVPQASKPSVGEGWPSASQTPIGLCPSALLLLMLGFLSQVQSCSYPLRSLNDLGYLKPGAHHAWPCTQLSLIRLCVTNVLLWSGPRKGPHPPAVDYLGTSLQGRDMSHVIGRGTRWLSGPKACPWGCATSSPCTQVPLMRRSLTSTPGH